jgi:hypothetical protein
MRIKKNTNKKIPMILWGGGSGTEKDKNKNSKICYPSVIRFTTLIIQDIIDNDSTITPDILGNRLEEFQNEVINNVIKNMINKI